MSLALRYGTSGSFFLAALLLLGAQFLPLERIEYRAENADDGSATAHMWHIEGRLPEAPRGENYTSSGAWYSGSFSGADGITMLRIAPPLILLGMLSLIVCGFMVLSARGIATGWTGTASLLVAGVGMLLLLLGINSFGKGVPPTNWVTDATIRPDIGFWSMFLGLLIGCGAALASFSVRPEIQGRIGPDGQPLPPLPILSVENPTAFNPMANRDPRPFRQEEFPYMTFEQTGGRRTFKPKPGEPAEEWQEAPPPAAPGDDAGKAAAKPAAAPPAKPAAAPKPAGTPPAAPSRKP